MLVFHIFNNITIASGIKLCYIPTALSFILSLFLINFKSKFELKILLYIIITGVSSIVSASYVESLGYFFNLTVIVISTLPLIYLDIFKFKTTLNISIGFSLLLLLINYYSIFSYRYQGFYNDPNYLCTTLLVFLYLVLKSIGMYKNIAIKILVLFEVLMILMLVSFTLSRTGLLCISLLVLIFFLSFIKKHIITSIFLILCISFFSSDFIIEQKGRFNERMFERSDDMMYSSNLRLKMSMHGVNFVFSNPSYLFTGIGIGNTGVNNNSKSLYITLSNRDHNSITSSISEQGLLAFILYVLIYWDIFKVIYKISSHDRWFKLTMLLSIFIFSTSIWLITFLPYWFILFVLGRNEKLNNYEYNTCC